jgi:hypothetical protein
MPLQPPSPEYLSAAPDPEPASGGGSGGSGRHRSLRLAGLALVVLAATAGVPELIW